MARGTESPAKAIVLGLGCVLAFGCGPRPLVSDTWSKDKPAETATTTAKGDFSYQAYIEAVYNAHNPDAIDKYFTSGVVVHSAVPDAPGGTGTGYLKDLAKTLLKGFPDLKVTVQDVVREGDKLAARVVLEGTHKGEFAGVAPTERKVKVANFAMYRLEGDKIAEVWSLVDFAALTQQLTEKK